MTRLEASIRLGKWATAFLWVSALSGCATEPRLEEYKPVATACCNSISSLTFRPMPLGQELELSLTPASPTLEFSGRRQHVAAVKIPDRFDATMLQVRVYPSGLLVFNMSGVVPEFVFLDENQKLIETRPTEDFQRETGFWKSGVNGRVTVPAGARYFVVKPGDGSRGVPMVHADTGKAYRVNPAALGDFSLRIFGEHRR